MNFKTLNAFIKIIRPLNIIITFMVIASAIIFSGASFDNLSIIILPSLCGALLAAAGMIINDIMDVEIDKINQPQRVLPSGLVSQKLAYIWYYSLNAVALFIAVGFPIFAQTIVFVALFLIYFYSTVLKKTLLLGNLVVAALTGLTFIYGGAIVGNYNKILLPALFAFLINFAREVVKDFEDIEGDNIANAKTFPVLFGKLPTQILVTLILLILLYCAKPLLANGSLIPPSILFIYIPIVTSIYKLWKNTSKESLHKISSTLKFVIIGGLVLLYFL